MQHNVEGKSASVSLFINNGCQSEKVVEVNVAKTPSIRSRSTVMNV